jgi:ubiquinone/menaquinone biosynthesis C-methylase UbiE
VEPPPPRFGLGVGKVFPAAYARSLLHPLRRLVQPPRATIDAIQLQPQDRVLEVGSGPGYFSLELAAAVPAGCLVVLDLQPGMLHFARRRLVEYPNAAFVAADAQHLPMRAASFDVAFLATMLGEVLQPATCLAEVHRLLRPGGILAVAETRRDADFIPLPSLRALLEANGFAFLSCSGIAWWQYLARFRRESSAPALFAG